MSLKKNIRSFVLSHSATRELFFFIMHKKINKKRIDKKIANSDFHFAERNINAIVSLTSYGERLNELQYTLYSLVSQSVRPEKIIVNLAEKDFLSVPPILRLFESYGVEYCKTEDLKSYKKLIPTLQKYPDKIIVTADDDLYYPYDWLEKLWEGHIKYPDCVICHLTKTICFNEGKLIPYNNLKYNNDFMSPSYSNFILSGAGALFLPKKFYSDICNTELFLKLCPFADDIWDYFMCILNKTQIMQVSHSYTNVCYVNPYREYGIIPGETLSDQNVTLNKNDAQFQTVMNYYGLNESSLEQLLNDS